MLEAFGASGTTLIAAERTARHARLLELDPASWDVFCRRFEASAQYSPAELRFTSRLPGHIHAAKSSLPRRSLLEPWWRRRRRPSARVEEEKRKHRCFVAPSTTSSLSKGNPPAPSRARQRRNGSPVSSITLLGAALDGHAGEGRIAAPLMARLGSWRPFVSEHDRARSSSGKLPKWLPCRCRVRCCWRPDPERPAAARYPSGGRTQMEQRLADAPASAKLVR